MSARRAEMLLLFRDHPEPPGFRKFGRVKQHPDGDSRRTGGLVGDEMGLVISLPGADKPIQPVLPGEKFGPGFSVKKALLPFVKADLRCLQGNLSLPFNHLNEFRHQMLEVA